MADLFEQVGTCEYNDIFASATPTAHVATVKLAESQGELARGTLVSGAAGGELTVVAAALATTGTSSDSSVTITSPAVYVLAEDVDTGTEDAVYATAYVSGHFRREALVTKSYALTAADVQYLRTQGILTTDSID